MRIRLRKGLTRRDQCYHIAPQLARLTPAQAAKAWKLMAHLLEKCGSKDIPKFWDLFLGVVAAANVAVESTKRSESLAAAKPRPAKLARADAADTPPAAEPLNRPPGRPCPSDDSPAG